MAEESDQSSKQPEKKKKPSLEEQEKALEVRRSLWPFALALALVVTFIGIMTGPILLVCGLAFLITAIIGWGVEKR